MGISQNVDIVTSVAYRAARYKRPDGVCIVFCITPGGREMYTNT